MTAAALRNARITIQNKTVARTAMGDETDTWATLATVWAYKRELRGREIVAADALIDTSDVVFLIQYITGITVESRIVCDDIRYEITRPPVRVGNKRRELELHASRGVRDGR
jgi:SPP1 family predicted phage head-tail adaptor